MRLLALTATLLGPLCARALVQFTNDAFTGITAGQAFNMTWQGDGTPVTITLMNGSTTNLVKVVTVATSAIGASYSWVPPTTLASGTYVLSIAQSGSTNYSPQFPIAGGTGASANPSPSPSAKPATQNTAVASTSYPKLSSYPPPTGTWAAFTALAALVSPTPLPTSNSFSSTIIPTSFTGYVGNNPVFPGRADRIGATGLAGAVLAIAAGVANMA